MLEIFTFEILVALLTLTTLEIVLGVDNLVFISVVTKNLPKEKQDFGRRIGLIGAMVMRIALLFAIAWIISLSEPFATIYGFAISWRDVILFGGGIFLLVKATHEIHNTVEGADEISGPARKAQSMPGVIAQIMALDLVFSLDSVITAVGMVDDLWVMVVAIVIAVLVMLWASKPLAEFIEQHPTVKMLALSFLLLVGVVLVADGLHFHIPRGYIYFSVAFAILVEILNLVARKNRRKKRKQQG